ncbi:PA0069 family radical SAM protein [Bergeyella sp. RCAD1439]|uniref:PA0069 family radical SAM protein n=1 Tax=Bergeyella anatis TaxID=3113737 RepID=UPI002E181A70|nr:PA0069 family radical SAM protein [Bergeyella sp. RCAD1439]
MDKKQPPKGQGAQQNEINRFDRYHYSPEDEPVPREKTTFTEVFPKTIVNTVKSTDLPMDYSLNPYQGCEHGCSYCYARPTHEYLGYSAGLDFERKIMVKSSAPALLEKFFRKKGYAPSPIILSGNTDPYQPIERKLEITRKLLTLFRDYRHPVSIITKNALILRDLDILAPLAEQNLVQVNLSLPTINEDLRKVMEPRTSTVEQKLKTIEKLSEAGIPVKILCAPVIPGLNAEEGLLLYKTAAEKGAMDARHLLIRLNDTVQPIFTRWLEAHFPDRAEKVLNQIRALHGGHLGEKKAFLRYKGQGPIAELIHTTYRLARKKYFGKATIPELSTQHFTGSKSQQLRLF